MSFLKDYKGMAFVYLILTLINIIWLVSYDKPNSVKQVNVEKKGVVLNS